MDKYEYNVKSDQIKKLYAKKDYETAAEIADSIDWSRVKNNSMLALVADAYEGTKQYDKARNVLEIAYERSPLGKTACIQTDNIIYTNERFCGC